MEDDEQRPLGLQGLNIHAESQEKGKLGMEILTFEGWSLSPEIPALGKQNPSAHA